MRRQPWTITREMFLSESETNLLLDALERPIEQAPSDPTANLDRLIVETLLFTGLRTSEFCRLRVADFVREMGHGAFHVRGRAGNERTVCIPDHVTSMLHEYIEQARPALLPPNVRPDDVRKPLIYHERHGPFERTGLYRRVVRILTGAGLGDRASVQLLRHTYGYLAYLRTGGNLLFVQRQLGHAHPMITSVYAQFVDESYPTFAERVAECDRVSQRE